MKSIDRLSVNILNFGNRAIDNIVKAQRDTAEIIWADVVNTAPYKNGDYVASIQLGETKVEGNIISTSVYTDATVTTLSGTSYNLGKILEYGTAPHAIPNAWGKGYTFGYVGKDGEYHKGTMDPDWHPGSISKPHFLPALRKNEALYYDNIRKAVKEAK